MPFQEHFDRFPAFPADVETFPLFDISYSKLLSNDPEESLRLFKACRQSGFFSLNLSDCNEGTSVLRDVEEIFDISRELYDLPEGVLDQYHYKPPHDLHGYKCVGSTKIEDGRPDNIEMYNFTRDSINELGAKRNNPSLLETRRPLFQSFINKAHPAVELILHHLESHMQLPQNSLTQKNLLDQPSSSAVRLLKASHNSPVPRTNLLGHTDIGVITMLFNVIGGLQILPPGSPSRDEQHWKYIKPRAGHALINLADAMVEWSGGLLRSNLHRVITPPGRQWSIDRYSIAYQVRATSTASMERLKSELIPAADCTSATLTAGEWEAVRAAGIKAGRGLPESSGGEIQVPVLPDVSTSKKRHEMH